MAGVDPEDDRVRRFVVLHYRYDPDRHERRHVVVAAFDNRREYLKCMDNVQEEIEHRKGNGEHVDPREYVSGAVYEPGARRRAANGRLVERALRHGVAPGPWIDELEMPANMGMFRAGGSARLSPRWASRTRRLIPRWHGWVSRP